jgi:low affinity Fe/Cu permease
MNELFRKLSNSVSAVVGSSWSFIVATAVVVVWAVTGPIFKFSDTWQLVINTGTTIVTFLMVFLIQNTQNRDAQAMHLKLDELIRAAQGARNTMVDVEHCSDEELKQLQAAFERLRENAPQVADCLDDFVEDVNEEVDERGLEDPQLMRKAA